MKIPERSPDIDSSIYSESLRASPDAIAYAKRYNELYLHWDELRYREFGTSNRMDVWRLMKLTRIMSYRQVGIGSLHLSYSPYDSSLQKMLLEIDSRALSGFPMSCGVDAKEASILSIGFTMEESIASSQLEGASTTTELAKKLLRSGHQPNDRSQRMILNNYRAMQLIKEHLNEPLSIQLILDVHRTVTDELMDDPDDSGRFRGDDSIVIRDVYDDVAYHVPPKYEEIYGMMGDLCSYANDGSDPIHPIIKGIVLHYALAYIHPFKDGNGRVSRALFYWYCMKNSYAMMEFLSISKTIKNHRQGYDMAYLLSETDGDDITYFIRYNLKMVLESIRVLDDCLERRDAQHEGPVDGLSSRQTRILKDMMREGGSVSQYEISVRYQISVPTARRDLLKLMERGLVKEAGKDGHRQLYALDSNGSRGRGISSRI